MKIELPEAVAICGVCRGYGAYKQRFLEGQFTSKCECCKGFQFVYKGTGKPISRSVVEQIKNSNGLIERQPRLKMTATLWPKEAEEIDDWGLTPSGACYEIKSEWPARPVIEKGK